MYDSNKRYLFRVSRTEKNPKYSWRAKPRVRYGGIQMAVQTHLYSKFGDKYDVKVELLEVTSMGEIDMAKYMQRNNIETFLK